MLSLCKDCNMYKSYGFSPVCKYCENDGKCPICGKPLSFGDDLNGPMYICSNGHKFDERGREFWDEFFTPIPRW